MKPYLIGLIISSVNCIIGYPFQFAYKCSKPVENYTTKTVDQCKNFVSYDQPELDWLCREEIKKNAFIETSFSIPYGESCEFFGNGYAIQVLRSSLGLLMTTDMYKYSDKNICDLYDRDVTDAYSGYNELYRVTEFKPNIDCGIHAVVKAMGHENDSSRRKIVIKTAYDG